MIPVDQTICNFTNGNCFQACVASIFELPLDDVPSFMGNGPDYFNERVQAWCDEMNLIFMDVKIIDIEVLAYYFRGVHIIVTGKSPRDPENMHCVVWKDGQIVHDPHPSKDGLVGDPEIFSVFIVKDCPEYLRKDGNGKDISNARSV